MLCMHVRMYSHDCLSLAENWILYNLNLVDTEKDMSIGWFLGMKVAGGRGVSAV